MGIALFDQDYVLAEGGCWIGIDTLAVRIKQEDEGVSVRIYVNGKEDEAPITETYAFFSEADEEEIDESNLVRGDDGRVVEIRTGAEAAGPEEQAAGSPSGNGTAEEGD